MAKECECWRYNHNFCPCRLEAIKIKAQIEVLKEVIELGDYRMGRTGLMAGAHYGELKKRLAELEVIENG